MKTTNEVEKLRKSLGGLDPSGRRSTIEHARNVLRNAGTATRRTAAVERAEAVLEFFGIGTARKAG
jgi:hypothetical protein